MIYGMDSKKSDKGLIVIFFFLAALAFGVFFCCLKSGFAIDELITIGQANSSKGGWIRDVREEYTDGVMIGHQITGKELFEFLTVSNDERFNVVSPYLNLATDCHPPLYHMLLKVASSFVTSSFSKWPGLVLNLIIFMLCNLLVYKICNKIFNDRLASSVTMLLYAISLSSLSSLIFIRMYILLSLMTLLLMYEVMLILEKPRPVIYPAVTLTILMGMFTQYNYVFAAFFFCLVTLVVLLKRKQIKTALFFSVSALLGVGLLIPVFPAIFTQFNFGVAEGSTVSVNSTMNNILDFASYPATFAMNIQILLSDSMAAVVIVILAAMICLCVKMYLEYRKSSKGEDYDKYKIPSDNNAKTILIMTAVTLVLSFACIALSVSFPDQRYLHHLQALIYPFVCLVICIMMHNFRLISAKVKNVVTVVLVIAVLGASIRAVAVRSLPYLFTEYPSYQKTLDEYTHCPCLYVDPEHYDMIDAAALQFLVRSDDVFITNPTNLSSDELKKYVEEHADNGKLLVYIFDLKGKEGEILDYLSSSFGYKVSKPLFTSVRVPCYLITVS